MDSVWMIDRSNAASHPPLVGAVAADVVVIGGGITGVSTALRLLEGGQRVVLLEASRIGASNTGGSTGNLYGTLSAGLAPLRDKWGAGVTRDVVAMRLQAVAWIERVVARLAIDCGFARRPLYTGVASEDPKQLDALEEEFAAAQEARLAPEWLDRIPELPMPLRRAMRIDGQAQFNPYCYTRAVAKALAERGVMVHEHSAVTDIDARTGVVRTGDGEVRAGRIVLATHTPKGFSLVQAEMEVYREYGVAARLSAASGPGPNGIFWVRDRSRSIRSYHHGGRDYLVVVGEKHKAGEYEAGTDHAEQLRETARRNFAIDGFDHEWSAQQFKPADGLPYIGAGGHDNVYIATGFAADGLTWGTVAAEVIGSLIAGRESRVADLLTPRRFTPVKSAKVWAAENATVLRHFVGDRLGTADAATLASIGPGEGRVVDIDSGKLAVYRAADGELTVLSPVCPHLKCHVGWNPTESTWDCPCHGSRFDAHGSVIEGPALRSLQPRTLGTTPMRPLEVRGETENRAPRHSV